MPKSIIGFETAGELVDGTNNAEAKAQADSASQITKTLPTVDQAMSPRCRAD